MAQKVNSLSRLFTRITLCAVVALGSLQVMAGPLATTNFALNDGFGPDAGRWHGSVSISGGPIPFFGDVVAAEVDWAAFGPGKFQLYLNSQSIAQFDPSAPGEVIYVYQITSVTAASPAIDTLTVGIDPGDGRGIISAPVNIPTGAATEITPFGGGDNNTSMAWFFNNSELPPLGVGNTSSLLVFTSPFAPEFDFLQVNAGLAGPSPSPLVASPSDRIFQNDIPEPSSILLGLAGVQIMLVIRSRKSSRS